MRHALKAVRYDQIARITTKLKRVEQMYLDDLMAASSGIERRQFQGSSAARSAIL